MFIHWGLYTLAGQQEWIRYVDRLTEAEYEVYREHFDPDLFDPRAWARAAKAAGMRYVVLTSKHHDGFCLWDSDLTDYTSVNTPFGRDIVAEFTEAVRAEGLQVGLYHSLVDWHHPDFTVDCWHPRNDGDLSALNAERDMARYRSYLHGQVRELLTRYGTIDYLFFDFTYPQGRDGLPGKSASDWDAPALLAMVRDLQPQIIVNDRLGIPGDLSTPEQFQPSAPVLRDGVPIRWEACQTLNSRWSYDPANHDAKSPDLLVRMLIDGVSKGGNLLLNVGPTGRGRLPETALATLAAIGRWMDVHERSIRGAGPTELTPPPDARYTQRGNRLYLHLFAWPLKHVHLPGLAGRVAYAQFLHDATQVTVTEHTSAAEHEHLLPDAPPGSATLNLPVTSPDVAVPVIEIFLRV